MSSRIPSVAALGRSTVAGFVAFAAVFLAVPAVAGTAARRQFHTSLATMFPMSSVGDQTMRLAFAANAHFVPVDLGGVVTLHPVFTARVEYVAVVPVLALVAAGAAVADGTDCRASLTRGAAVALGYVAAAVLAAVAFGATTSVGSRTIAPNLLHYVTATATHAVAFGALGGLVGYATWTDEDASLERVLDAVPVRVGAAAGAVAFAVGYAATYVLGTRLFTLDSPAVSLAGSLADSLPWIDGTVNAAAYLLYGAQHVPLSPVTTARRPANFVYSQSIAEVFGTVAVLHVVPVLVLVGAGYLAAHQTDTGILAGAAVAFGYGAVAVLGLLVFASTAPDGSTIRPEPIVTLLRSGVTYPLVFASLGGLLADR